jgi:hypothetical protein
MTVLSSESMINFLILNGEKQWCGSSASSSDIVASLAEDGKYKLLDKLFTSMGYGSCKGSDEFKIRQTLVGMAAIGRCLIITSEALCPYTQAELDKFQGALRIIKGVAIFPHAHAELDKLQDAMRLPRSRQAEIEKLQGAIRLLGAIANDPALGKIVNDFAKNQKDTLEIRMETKPKLRWLNGTGMRQISWKNGRRATHAANIIKLNPSETGPSIPLKVPLKLK